MKRSNRSDSTLPASTRVTGSSAIADDGGRLITLEKNVWRVFCLLGNGHVSGSCGHSHRILTRALRCSYEPLAYQRDPDAELRVRAVKAAR